MPYCTQCGTQAGGDDSFCGKCGARQPGKGANDGAPNPWRGQNPADWGAGISNKNASLLCYIPWLGWIACVFVLASQRFKRDTVEGPEVRFHAFQGLYLFVVWLIVDWILSPVLSFSGIGAHHVFPGSGSFGGLLKLVIVATWIVMIVKTSQSEHYRLPIIGEMAERSVQEQRT